jgi:hypothetical protein
MEDAGHFRVLQHCLDISGCNGRGGCAERCDTVRMPTSFRNGLTGWSTVAIDLPRFSLSGLRGVRSPDQIRPY